MPSGGQGNFAGTMGYGGQFPGYGGSIGYTGGYGNPSSSGGGTAGQTQRSQNYAGSIRPYTPGGLAGGLTLGGTWAPYPTTSSQNPDLPQNQPGPRVSGKKPSPPIDPATGLPTLTPAQIAAGVTAPINPVTGVPIPQSKPATWGQAYGTTGIGGTANDQMLEGGNYQTGAIGGDWPNNISGYGFETDPRTNTGAYNPHAASNLRTGYGGGNVNAAPDWSGSQTGGIRGYQFGGPVAPGQRFTVGENGPETLQMGPNGGGQVIPNNPMDKLGGMNPQMMQAMFQLMQQQKPPGGPLPTPGQPPQKLQMPQPSQPPQTPGGGFQLGDWRKRMGIEGLSRPGMGFGGSGLGVSGIMPQMKQQLG